MRSSKQAAEKHLYTLHQRLRHALNLGTRYYDKEKRKWQCTDIEIQRHVVRSISSFLDCISGDTSHHPLVKDSFADMVGALVCILQHRSDALSNIAANVVVKLISILPSSITQSYLLDLVHPLSSMLSSQQFQVSISSAIALNMIFFNLSVKREKEVWEILIEAETVFRIVTSIREFPDCTMSIQYFQEMTSLLSTILHRWPSSRYYVWNDAKLMEVMEVMCAKPDISIKVAVLKLYSGLALCGNGAKKILETGGSPLRTMVLCMGRAYPFSVRMEGFRLSQILATNEHGCLKMMSLCCEPVVKAILDGMSGWTVGSGRIPNDQMSLLVEACRLALVVRWAGEHHDYFWKLGIGRVLLDLLLENFHDGPSHHFSSLEEPISKAREGLKANFLLVLRPYVWDILGWLTTYCSEDFNPSKHDQEPHINILIICACLSFADSIQKGGQICHDDAADSFRNESSSRAVLMMIYSPCKYIASKARFILSEVLKPAGKEYLKQLLHILNIASSIDNFEMPYILKIDISLMALTCYSCFPQYQSYIVESGGIKTLMDFIRWCLSNNVHIGRKSIAPHLHNMFGERTCCGMGKEDWEGNDILLFYGLWGLVELVQYGLRNNMDIFASQVDYSEGQFVGTLQDICSDTYAPGLKWYAAYILSYFGLYGFPCKLGRKFGKALNEHEYADMQLILRTGGSISVHGVIVAARCPSLLPSDEWTSNVKVSGGSLVRYETEKQRGKFQKEIHLSSHVDNQALAKLLEFVYLGYLHAGEELVKKLKILSKHCALQPLLIMLCRKRPKWGALFPNYGLTPALTTVGHRFTDVILEAKPTESISWTCSVCPLSAPHMHADKVVLWSSCDYLRALFQSGMQESHSQTIKVPVSWDAMIKLVNWFYTEELRHPPSGCLWDNMNNEEKLHVLQPYLELCWLAEFWVLEDVQYISHTVIVSCLDSARHLSVPILKLAADLSLWKVAEVAADYLAPLYHQLFHSGDLEVLDVKLVDMIRAASVRLSQEVNRSS